MTANIRAAVIGNGIMGTAIATRLLDCRLTPMVFDRNPEKMQRLVEKGAIAGTSSASAAAGSEFVILSVNTAADAETAVFGRDGVAEAAAADKLLVDMSSIDPVATAAMSMRLKSETGMRWIDSPLSGGAPGALAGKLVLMLGGDTADIDRARPLLAHLSASMTHIGGNGAGQTAKLINQVLCACNFLSVAEATRLALDAGIDAAKLPAALAGGRADSAILQEYMAKMATYDYTPSGRIDNMLKDLDAVQRLAERNGTPIPLTSMIANMHRMMIAAGYGAEDSAAYMKLFDFGLGASGGRGAAE